MAARVCACSMGRFRLDERTDPGRECQTAEIMETLDEVGINGFVKWWIALGPLKAALAVWPGHLPPALLEFYAPSSPTTPPLRLLFAHGVEGELRGGECFRRRC